MPLTQVINASIREKNFPEIWKTAKVVPLHKKGSKTERDNYRPISLLPSLSKVLEKVLVRQIVKYYEQNSLFPNSQYGFRTGRSTSQAIQDLKNHVDELNVRGVEHAVVFLDFSKAFDIINHKILYTRMKHYGFAEGAIMLIKSYLTGRMQYVQLEGSRSKTRETDNIGCPQGSCLGPLLYIMYTADMGRLAGEDHSVFFADDTAIVIKRKAQNISFLHQINMALDRFLQWINANFLKINENKTVIYIKNSKENIAEVKVGSTRVKCTPNNMSTKYLGVLMNGNMKWGDQGKAVVAKMKKGRGAIFRANKTLTEKSLRLIYNAFVDSHFMYAAEVWYPECTKKQRDQIETVQKAAIRTVTKTHKLAHSAPLFRRCGVLRAGDRIELMMAKTLIKASEGKGLPPAIQQQFQLNATKTRSKFTLKTSIASGRMKLAYGNTLNKYKTTILDPSIKLATKIKHIKCRMLEQYVTNCNKRNCVSCSAGTSVRV